MRNVDFVTRSEKASTTVKKLVFLTVVLASAFRTRISGFCMYRAIGLLRPNTDFTLDEAQSRLAAKFPGFDISRTGEQLLIRQGEWWIALALTSGPQIAMEIEGLVSHLAGVELAEAQEYIASARRIEVWTDVSDPFMEHFNDYFKVIEVLKSFNGLLAVDPNERGLL